MKRIKTFFGPPTALAEQQALSWVAKMTSGELNQNQRAEFAVWLNLHPSHSDLFDELADVWELSGKLSDESLARIGQTSQQHEAHEATEPQASLAKPDSTENLSKTHWLSTLAQQWRLGFGLPVALASIIAVALVWTSFQGKTQADLHETSTGGYAKVALSDGSILHLNTNTRVRVRYTQNKRQLQLLAGELFIEVAKDASRPLTVRTASFTATAIGTAFGVAATPTQRWVAVAEGEVMVSNQPQANYLVHGNSETLEQKSLLAGEKLKVDEGSRRFDLVETDNPPPASWRGGQLVYRNMALGDLIADLNRYHPQQLVIHDNILSKLRLSAVLNSNNHQSAVAALTSSLDLQSHPITDNITLLTSKP